ncbi:MAG: type I DNA topoisomerase [Candidatus Spechtbacteria bacterium]|nr:type I DNA topoisomerase [Candidatus Spechtbacteria bacterium]
MQRIKKTAQTTKETQLIIVESPTKAKTISKFLPSEYTVESSYGHVRDLPTSTLGVDTEHDFAPKYIVPMKAKKRVTELKKKAAAVDSVILATDADREGEAISWHLAEVLKLKDYKRIVFHEITKTAIEHALESPRKIDDNLVDAQQARRILDRLVGYKLSPFLWKKVMRGLSAGRVQSVAVRLVVDREREIEKFVPQEYWSVEAWLQPRGVNAEKDAELRETFLARLYAKDEKPLEKLDVHNKKDADEILNSLKSADWSVKDIARKETKRNPMPPFTTSTLQQEAARKLGFSAKRTMMLAQNLYERGYITYHRTDSLNITDSALSGARDFIETKYGKQFWAGAPRLFKTKSKGAQEAHEAIRPAFAEAMAGKPAYSDREPGAIKMEDAQRKLYALIWQRFIASQMAQAVFDSTAATIATGTPYTFRANGSIMKFEGFLRVYPVKVEENELPDLKKDQPLILDKLADDQHFTEPPARYSEASLVKALEEFGIGRPSTYAPTLSTIQERNYITKNEQKRFQPTEIGITVTDLLVEHFPQIVDIQFTANVEQQLDEVATGEKNWVKILHTFYDPFKKLLEEKYEEVKKATPPVEETDKICPQCGKNLVIRNGRFGRFYACSGFPDCKYTAPLEQASSSFPQVKCPKCLADQARRDNPGFVKEIRTKRGKIFYGCSRYPECDFAVWDKPQIEGGGDTSTTLSTGNAKVVLCPKCGNALVETKKGIKCSSRECDYKEEN